MLRFLQVIRYGMRDPNSRSLFISTGVVLAVGTVVYTLVEDWSIFTSFYFCVITLTTVGFGDPIPTRTFSKAFTIPYVLAGIGLIVTFANTYLRLAAELRAQRRDE